MRANACRIGRHGRRYPAGPTCCFTVSLVARVASCWATLANSCCASQGRGKHYCALVGNVWRHNKQAAEGLAPALAKRPPTCLNVSPLLLHNCLCVIRQVRHQLLHKQGSTNRDQGSVIGCRECISIAWTSTAKLRSWSQAAHKQVSCIPRRHAGQALLTSRAAAAVAVALPVLR